MFKRSVLVATLLRALTALAIAFSLLPFPPLPTAHASPVNLQYLMGTSSPDTSGGMVMDDQYVWIADHKVGLWRVERCSGGSSGYVGTGGSALWDLWQYNSTGNYPANPDAGYYIYGAGKSGFLNVYDTARPGDKYVTGVSIGGGVAYGVYATEPARHKVYVATTLGLQVYDIANPINPILLTTIRPDLDFVAARGEPGHRYMLAASFSDNRLYIVDTANDSVVSSLGFGMTGMIRRPWLGTDEAGNWYAYVVNDYGDLWIVNVDNPAAPALVSFWNSPYGGATNMPGGNVWMRQGYAYVMTSTGNDQGYLYMLDVRDLAHPALVDYLYDSALGFNEIRIEGCEIHIATHNGWKMYTMTGWQPDAWISQGDQSNYVGQDVYEDLPVVQIKEQTVVPTQTAIYQIRIENDADRPDMFYVAGTGGATGWTVQYLQGTTDVTTAVVSGSYLTDLLRPAQYVLLTLKVTPDFSATCRRSSLEGRRSSLEDGDLLDITVIADSWMCPTGQCSGATDVVLARTALGCPQMTVAKDDGQISVQPGDSLPYVISFANVGNVGATSVVITDTLPAGTTYVSANPAPASVTAGPGGMTRLTWNVGGIPARSGPYTVTLHGRVNAGVSKILFRGAAGNLPPASGSLLTDTVTLGYADVLGTPYPPVSAEDVDEVAASPLVKGVDKAFAGPGETLAYTLTVGYLGEELLGPLKRIFDDAVVTDTVPAGASYLPGSATAGGVYVTATNTISWTLGSNRPGSPGVSAPPGTALCPAPFLVLTADRDTYVQQDQPDNNFGTTDPLRTTPKASAQKHVLVHFNLGSIPAGAVVQSAIFRVSSANARSDNFAQVRQMLTEWTETGATWNKRDGTNGWAAGAFSSADYGTIVYGTLTPIGGNTQVAANVTGLAQNWLSSNRGLVMLATGTDSGDASWGSRENGTSTRRPTLEMRYLIPTIGGCSDTDTLSPVADTFIEKGNQTRNNGADTTMFTNPGNNNTTNNTKHSLIQFDLVSIPPGATINSAVLDLYVSTARSSNHSDSVHRMLTAWTEAGATWKTRNGTNAWASGATFGSSDYAAAALGNIVPSSNGHKTLDIAGAVNDWLNNGVTNDGLALLSTGSDNGDAKYATREEENHPDRQPSLTVSWSLTANSGPSTRTDLSAWPLLVGGAGQVTVTMQVTVSATVANVTPSASLSLSAVGTTATKASGPTPAGPVTVTPAGPATFTYVYDVTPGSGPGEITFSGKPSSPDAQFATATSNSVLTVSPLTFRATVNDPATVNPVVNQATFWDRNAYPDGARSNLVETRLGGAIGGTVWHDADGDGVRDAAEAWPGRPGIAGVVVRLTRGTDVYTATTAATGYYLFEQLPAGSYNVVVDAGSLPAGLALTTGNLPLAVTLSAGQEYWAADFGYDDTGVLGDMVFRDPNGNGVQDPGEAGLPNVTVKLYTDSNGNDVLDAGEPLLATAVSDANGHHSFTGLPAGSYLVYADEDDPDLPAGYRPTAADPRAVTLAIGQTKDDVDFGFTLFGSISDRVWADLDGDGVQGLGEPGLGGLQLILTGPTGTLYVTTASDGFYAFDNLPGGTYTVTVNPATVPAGYGLTTGNDVLVIGLGVGENVTTADFGYDGTGAIGDTVWADLNGDGVQYRSEVGISNVAVRLYLDANGNGLVDPSDTAVGSDVTDPAGHYSFTGLPPGDYLVDVDQDDPNMPAYTNTTPNPLPVSLGPGQTRDDADVGFGPYAQLGDFVWNDLDGDGVQDPGEPGLAGVVLTLTDGEVTVFDSGVYTTTTGAAGYYLFAVLAPATYTVTVAAPAGYALTTGNLPYAVTLAAGDYHLTADFGFRGLGSIGDLVWDDTNGNGAYEPGLGETGLPDVTVFLFQDLNGNGRYEDSEPLMDTARTDAAGHYLLGGLPAGDYTALVQLDDPALPSGAGPTTYQPVPVNLAAGQSYLDADFGFGNAGAIGDTVYYDANGNGERDQGTGAEYGIPNVTLWLYRDNNSNGIVDGGDALLATATTDVNGFYFFGGLAAGAGEDYVVQMDESDPDIPAGLHVTTPNPHPVADLEAGQFYEDADFGFGPFAFIGDLVWNDVDGDATQDPGEVGLGGVTLRLYDNACPPTGAPIATVATDAGGAYSFTSLAAGIYCVDVDEGTVPAGSALTTANDPLSVTLAAGQGYTAADFGYRVGGSVSGVVFHDLNASGTRGPGELGIGGVTIALYAPGPDGLLGTADDVLVATTVTSGDGSYAFLGLSPGAYRVVETDPPGYASTTLNAVDVLVPAGGSAVADFGDVAPTAVLVIAFTATREPDGVRLRWTVVGFPADGFGVYRATHPKGPYDLISAEPVFSITGDFEYLDRSARPGVVYWYKLRLSPSGDWFGPITSALALRVRTFVPLLMH